MTHTDNLLLKGISVKEGIQSKGSVQSALINGIRFTQLSGKRSHTDKLGGQPVAYNSGY